MKTITFSVPSEDIDIYQYHVATLLGDVITSSGARPDEFGIITENVPIGLPEESDPALSQEFAHTYLAGRNRETDEWYFSMDFPQVNLRTFVLSLAVTMRQSQRPASGSRFRSWDGPPIRFDNEIKKTA